MIKIKTYAKVLAVAAVVSLSACGGDSDNGFRGGATAGGGNGGAGGCDTSTVSGVVCYINNLIATATLDTNPPTDISGVTLATDETSPAVANP